MAVRACIKSGWADDIHSVREHERTPGVVGTAYEVGRRAGTRTEEQRSEFKMGDQSFMKVREKATNLSKS